MANLPPAGWYDDGSGRQRYWNGTGWTESYAPSVPAKQVSIQQQPVMDVPGRTSGFVCGLIAAIFVAMPIVALPVGIPGWVLSAKAMKRLPEGSRGRGLAIAGLVLSICAVCLTSLFMLMAIPGALARNFG